MHIVQSARRAERSAQDATNRQRMANRRSAHENGRWVREAALAYADEQARKEAVPA